MSGRDSAGPDDRAREDDVGQPRRGLMSRGQLAQWAKFNADDDGVSFVTEKRTRFRLVGFILGALALLVLLARCYS